MLKDNIKTFDPNHEKIFLEQLEAYDNNHFYVKSKPLEKEIQTTLNQILLLIKQNYDADLDVKICLVDNPRLINNAYTLPNGTILIDLSTLSDMRDIEELWFLIAHECAHILKQHSIVYSNIEDLPDKLTNSFLKKFSKNP